MSLTNLINLTVSLEGGQPPAAGFGTVLILSEHTVTGDRINGPYSSLSEMADDGFSASNLAYVSAGRVFSQQPRITQLYVGRRAAAESVHTSMAAIEAAAELVDAQWYITVQTSRADTDVIALANFTSARSQICAVQFSSALALTNTASTIAQESEVVVGGTATDGDYVIEIVDDWTGAVVSTSTVTRATTPATNNDIATALEVELDADLSASVGIASVSTDTITIAFVDAGHSYTVNVTAPAPGTLVHTVTVAPAANPAQEIAAFDRAIPCFYATDAEYLDAAVVGRCGAFALDAPNGAGTWHGKQLVGIAASPLSSSQRTALRAQNVNYLSPVTFTSGVVTQAFFRYGTMANGSFVDVRTTTDWFTARMQEALLGTIIGTPTKIPFTDSGLALFQSQALGVCRRGVTGAHFADGAVSSTTGRVTPWVDVPKASEFSTSQKQSRQMSLTGEAVLAGAIHSIGNATTVGFTFNFTF